jgi:hypothetical protein
MLKIDANSQPIPLWTSVGYRMVVGLISAYSLSSLTKSLSLPVRIKFSNISRTYNCSKGGFARAILLE